MSDRTEDNVHTLPQTNPHGSGGNGGGQNLHGRVSAIEAHLQHMATKAWVLGGVVGGMVSAALVTIAIIRLFAGDASPPAPPP